MATPNHEPRPMRGAWDSVDRERTFKRVHGGSGHDASRIYTPAGNVRETTSGPKRRIKALRDATRFTDPAHAVEYAKLGWTVTQCAEYYLAFPPRKEREAKPKRGETVREVARATAHHDRLDAILRERAIAALAYKPGFAG